MSTLYVMATPIGNLEDLSFRAIRILREVDLVLCEDTRVTRKLLEHYQIEVPVLSYHQHSTSEKVDYVLHLLEEGKNLALVSDAGTPGISDPGNELISKIVEKFKGKVKIIPIPGPSALTAAASVSGFPMNKFLFLGFLPKKRKRKDFFGEIVNSKYSVILYEAPYRIIKTLVELKDVLSPNRKIVVCRELTKKFETIYRGKIGEVIKQLEREKARGEFVIIIEGRKENL